MAERRRWSGIRLGILVLGALASLALAFALGWAFDYRVSHPAEENPA